MKKGEPFKFIFNLLLSAAFLALATGAEKAHYVVEKELIDALLEPYEASARPIVKENDTIVVEIYPEILRVEGIDERVDTLSTSISVAQSWNDPRLRWEPNNYGNIQKIHLPLEKIWRPDISLYNVAPESEDEIQSNNYPVIVRHDGMVVNVPFVTLNSYCELDLQNFPFDIQQCSIVLGSWVYNAQEIKLQFWGQNTTSIDVPLSSYDGRGPSEHPSWNLLNKKAKASIKTQKYACCPEPYMNMDIRLQLQRAPQFFKYLLVGPGIILGLLVPLQFLLPPSSAQRSLFGVILILSKTILMTSLGGYFPYEHSSVPRIGIFFLASMAIAAAAVFLSTLVAGVAGKGKSRRAMPAWLSQLCLGSKGLRRLLCIAGTSPVNSMYSSVNSRLLEDMQEPAIEMMAEHDLDQASNGNEMYNSGTEAYLRSIAKSTRVTASKYVAEESLERLNSEWQDLAKVLDRLCFVVFLIVYLIIIVSFMSNSDKVT